MVEVDGLAQGIATLGIIPCTVDEVHVVEVVLFVGKRVEGEDLAETPGTPAVDAVEHIEVAVGVVSLRLVERNPVVGIVGDCQPVYVCLALAVGRSHGNLLFEFDVEGVFRSYLANCGQLFRRVVAEMAVLADSRGRLPELIPSLAAGKIAHARLGHKVAFVAAIHENSSSVDRTVFHGDVCDFSIYHLNAVPFLQPCMEHGMDSCLGEHPVHYLLSHLAFEVYLHFMRRAIMGTYRTQKLGRITSDSCRPAYVHIAYSAGSETAHMAGPFQKSDAEPFFSSRIGSYYSGGGSSVHDHIVTARLRQGADRQHRCHYTDNQFSHSTTWVLMEITM